jgi:DNA-binding NarL/FixJ family response regulator
VIRVLICDDQGVVCEGLRAILSTAPNIAVVALARHGAEAIERIAATRPDVVLMDLKMPVMDGVRATREIRSRFPAVRVLVLTTYDADEWLFEAVRAGASGYLLKDSPRDVLIAAVEGTAAGRAHVDPRSRAGSSSRCRAPLPRRRAQSPIRLPSASARCSAFSGAATATPRSPRISA